MRKWLLAFALMYAPVALYGQAVWIPLSVTQHGTVGAVANAVVIPSSPIAAFCRFPANGTPCTNKAQTYTDSTAAIACPTNTQFVVSSGSTCQASLDAQNNRGVLKPGRYIYTVTSGVVNNGPQYVSATCDFASACTVTGAVSATGNVTLSGGGRYIFASSMKCDGSTDDGAALQAAVTAAGQRGHVVMPVGTCILGSGAPAVGRIDVPDGLWLQGAGKYATTIKRPNGLNSTNEMFRCAAGGSFGAVGNCTLTDFTVDQNQANQTAGNDNINAGAVSKMTIERMRIINAWTNGIATYPTSGQVSADVLVADSDFESNGTRSGCVGVALCMDIRIGNPLRVRISWNRSENSQNFLLTVPTASTNGYVTVEENIVNNCLGFAVALGGQQTKDSVTRNVFNCPTSTQNIIDIANANDVVVSDNTVTMGTSKIGISDLPPALRVTVTGNRVTGNPSGPGTANCISLGGSDLTITGNYCDKAGGAGIIIAVANIGLAPSRNVLISANSVKDCSQASPGAHAGIELFLQAGGTAALSTVIIKGNNAFDDQGTPTQGWGIGLAVSGQTSGFSNITVSGNYVRGNKTAAIFNGMSGGTGVQISENTGE